jgi:hypothetical protein
VKASPRKEGELLPLSVKKGEKFDVPGHEAVEVMLGTYGNAAKKAFDLEADSYFYSDCRSKREDIPHTRNNWLRCVCTESRIMLTHCAIRANCDAGHPHLKSWLLETSVDRKSWREVDDKEDTKQLNGPFGTDAFPVTGGECLIPPVNIGRSHSGNDSPATMASEIYGNLIQ